MTALTTIDRNAAKLISAACEEALQEVAERFGLTVSLRGGSFDPSAGTYKPKVEFAMADSAEKSFARDCRYIYADGDFDKPLVPSDFGAEFVSQGRTFKVVGVNLRAPKFPILAEDVANGQTYTFGNGVVKTIIAKRSA